MLEIKLLGPVRAVVDGRMVPVDSARRRALLAALALREGATVSVDALCEILWGDDLPANARGNVQSHISRLRSSLGAGAVVLDHGGYRLVLGDPGTDIAAVEELVIRAAERKVASPQEAARLYADALAHWNGAALVEFADQPAFLAEAARLDELQRTITDDLHEALLDSGDAAAALPGIERTAIDQPLRERAQLLLVRALHEAGRSAEALRAADAYRRRLVDETGMNPGPALGALEQRVLAGADADAARGADRAPPPSRAGAALPRHGRFFGREAELRSLRRALDEARVVTVTGSGGVGKTRLVAEALAQPHLRHRTVTVELAAVPRGSVVQAVAAALALRTDGREPIDAVVEYLSVEALLLVLDNCEHVGDEVHELIRRLVSACAELRVLATSRVRIGAAGERIVPVGPLTANDAGDPAVELFVDRTRAVDPGFAPTADELAIVERVCRRLDGVPLAIELAAGRTPVFGLDGLVQRLDDALDVLEMPTLGADRRHATLRAVVDWSYRLLDDDARRVIQALSVFDGGFDLEGSERVAASAASQPVAAALGRLVDASLVTVDSGARPPRYQLLESVRSYASERLAAAGRLDDARTAHAAWAVDLLRGAAERAAGPDERLAAAAVARERANVRRACADLLAGGDAVSVASVAGALAELCLYRPDSEWLRWMRDAADRIAVSRDASGTHDLTRAAAARAAYLQGDLRSIEPLAAPVVDRSAGAAKHVAAHSLAVGALYAGAHAQAEQWWRRTVDDASARTPWRLDALGGIALAQCYAGDGSSAARTLSEHRALADAIDSDTYRAFAEYVAGELLLADGASDAAVDSLRRSATIAAGAGAEFVQGLALTALASALVRNGRVDVAAGSLVSLLELWRRAGTWPQMWTTLRLAAEALTAMGNARDAALLLAAAEHDAAAPHVSGGDARRIDALRERHRNSLPQRELDEIAIRARVTPRARVVLIAEQSLGHAGGP